MKQTHNTLVPARTASVQTIAISDTMRWLSAGVNDMRHAPAISLSYGMIITLIVFAVIQGGNKYPMLSLSFVSAFLIISPLLATGLYHTSRRREQGKKPLLRHALKAVKCNSWSIISFGIILGILSAVWGRIAGITIALSLPSLGYENISAGLFSWNALLTPTPNGWLHIALPLTVGFAVSAFAIAVIALPMLYHRPLDPVTAILQSLKAVRKSWPILLVWGLMIVTAIFAGIAMGYIALIVIMPVLAHASWHCYRQLAG